VDAPVRAYRGDQPYVFLCWSHGDSPTVFRDLELLAAHGINVWYDEGISAGSNWRGEIAKRIDGAARILFYVSRTALASDHCNREINYALDNGRAVVPVYLEQIELTPDLKIGLARVHALFRGTDPHFERHLIEALQPASAGHAASVARTAPAPRRSMRAPLTIALAAAATIGIAVASIVLWRQQVAPPPPAPQPPQATQPAASIAVLPFVNLSGDPQNEYFGDGVAEEILNALDRIEPLHVAARTSAFSFKGKDTSVKDIGGALGVANVLEGSVRRDGERVRINVELIDAATGFRVWSSSFDRDVHDIFAVQDEIAGAVAAALKTKLTAGHVPGSTTANIDAYNALLKGRALTTYARDEPSRAAIAYLKQAVALDPNYGQAYGELAIAYALGTAFMPFAEIAKDWSAAFTRALEINPRDANALVAKAYYVTLADWDWQAAGALYRAALDAGMPTHAGIVYGAFYLQLFGKSDEVRRFYKGTLDTDPFNIDILWDFANWLSLTDRSSDAMVYWNRYLEVAPGSAEGLTGQALVYALLGDARAARDTLARVDLAQLSPYMRHEYLYALWTLGDHDQAKQLLVSFEADASRGPGYRAALAWGYTIVGDREKALAAYEAACAASEISVLSIRWSPLNASLHDEPRYIALLKKMHLDDDSLRAAGLL